MTININYQNMPMSESLNGIVIKKLEKLSEKYMWLIRSDVLFKIENHNEQIERQCSITMSAPGPTFFAKAVEDNFEKSAKVALKRIERQLKKRKQDFQNKHYEKHSGTH